MVEKPALLQKFLLQTKQATHRQHFNDKLIGSDDLDAFTALAGDDEIMGLAVMTKLLLGQAMIPFMVEMEMITFNPERVMTKYMAKLEMTQYIYLQVPILRMAARA